MLSYCGRAQLREAKHARISYMIPQTLYAQRWTDKTEGVVSLFILTDNNPNIPIQNKISCLRDTESWKPQ